MRGGVAQFVRICAAIWLLALTAAAARAADPVAEIPYRISQDGWLSAPVMVNGEGPYDFLIDTAATRTVVFQSLADDFEFQPAAHPDIRVLGLTETQELPAYSLGDFDIDGEPLNNHIGVILPNWPAPLETPGGILGLDFLGRYAVMIDVNRQVLALYPPGALALPGSEWRRAPMRRKTYAGDTLYEVSLDMQGRDIRCIVDFGAAQTVLNYRSLRRLLSGVYVDPDRSSGGSSRSRLSDVFGNQELARRVVVSSTRLGRFRWGRKSFVVYNAKIFEELELTGRAACLIGADLLAEQSVVFDFADEMIYLAR